MPVIFLATLDHRSWASIPGIYTRSRTLTESSTLHQDHFTTSGPHQATATQLRRHQQPTAAAPGHYKEDAHQLDHHYHHPTGTTNTVGLTTKGSRAGLRTHYVHPTHTIPGFAHSPGSLVSTARTAGGYTSGDPRRWVGSRAAFSLFSRHVPVLFFSGPPWTCPSFPQGMGEGVSYWFLVAKTKLEVTLAMPLESSLRSSARKPQRM
jgi:hypothetical protein